jgi:hypothetical protein
VVLSESLLLRKEAREEPRMGVEIKVCWTKLHNRPVGPEAAGFCVSQSLPEGTSGERQSTVVAGNVWKLAIRLVQSHMGCTA